MAMKKNISKALALAVMMSVLAGGSAYAETKVIINGILDSTSHADPANGPSVKVVKDPYGSASYGYSFAQFNQDGKVMTVGSYGINLFSDNSIGIRNMADGVNPNDAVNKGQMESADADTLKKANEYTDQEIAKISGGASTEALEKLDNKINQTNDRVDRVGATAAALAGIHYQPMAKGQSQVAIGMGGYKGKKATALGLAYQISDRVSGSVAGAANGSEHMFNVGFNYLFGQHSDKDVAQMAAVPGSVSLKEAELQSQVDSLKADNASMKAEIAELKAMVKALVAK